MTILTSWDPAGNLFKGKSKKKNKGNKDGKKKKGGGSGRKHR